MKENHIITNAIVLSEALIFDETHPDVVAIKSAVLCNTKKNEWVDIFIILPSTLSVEEIKKFTKYKNISVYGTLNYTIKKGYYICAENIKINHTPKSQDSLFYTQLVNVKEWNVVPDIVLTGEVISYNREHSVLSLSVNGSDNVILPLKITNVFRDATHTRKVIFIGNITPRYITGKVFEII